MTIGVIGAGRLGLSFALLCEDAGFEVIASDASESYVKDLRDRTLVTYEPGIKELLASAKNITFTTSNLDVIRDSDILFIYVPTPSKYDGTYDVTIVERVLEQIVDLDVTGRTIVIGCTTNPNDCEDFQDLALYNDIVYSPEFIAQGSIISDMKSADMVLIGAHNRDSVDQVKDIYYAIQNGRAKFNVMSPTAAEITKMAVNCYITSKISYANMIGDTLIASGLEGEVDNVLLAIGDDRRIGHRNLGYGYGYGGPCLPRDNRSFARYAERVGIIAGTPTAVDEYNDFHAEFVAAELRRKNRDKSVPFYIEGVTYKKATDILTESQQYRLVRDLLEQGYTVCVKDIEPVVEHLEPVLKAKYGRRILFVDSKPSNAYEIKI